MPNFIILEGLFDTGYYFEDFPWWMSWVIFGSVVIVFGVIYFLCVWLYGRMKLNDEDKEKYKEYKAAKRKERKEIKKSARRPLKNVLNWNKIRGWFIPVIAFVTVVSMVATPVLYTTWDVLITTIRGSYVKTYDTPSALEAAEEAEKNVITIEEEGIVLLKNTNNTLPLKIEEGTKRKINVFGACAFGLFYGNGGSGSFQTDGRVTSFPRVATKLEVALEEEGYEINQNLFNFVKNYYNGSRISVQESNYDIQCGFNKYNYREIVPSKAPYAHEAPVSSEEDR